MVETRARMCRGMPGERVAKETVKWSASEYTLNVVVGEGVVNNGLDVFVE